jgi:hypothetical protein
MLQPKIDLRPYLCRYAKFLNLVEKRLLPLELRSVFTRTAVDEEICTK